MEWGINKATLQIYWVGSACEMPL